jgi:hypothetical protein
MAYFAGLDVSVKETSICIVDDAGKIVREVRVASEPEALLQVLTNTIYRFKRVGLEAGPPEGSDQQDRPQRCPRHRADGLGAESEEKREPVSDIDTRVGG